MTLVEHRSSTHHGRIFQERLPKCAQKNNHQTLKYFDLTITITRYFYESYTDDLSKAVQRSEIEKSLREWSEVADVSFVEVMRNV